MPKDLCGLEELGIEPPTLQLVDNPLYQLLSINSIFQSFGVDWPIFFCFLFFLLAHSKASMLLKMEEEVGGVYRPHLGD